MVGTHTLAIGFFLSPLAWALEGMASDSGAAAQLEDHRVVHRFDFDERKAGNMESIPKYWEPLRSPSFPGFTEGRFDHSAGHDAPPSFYLESLGRNVAYWYSGPATRVRADSEYRIQGFVQPNRLRNARACLSAFYLDRHRRPILASLVRSPFLGGSDHEGESDSWVRVDLHLPLAPPDAFTVGLTAWVLQETYWDTSAKPRRDLDLVDVQGGAWFDDITVIRLPHVELTTPSPGNVISSNDPPELRVVLRDQDFGALSGRVTITDAEGRLLQTHPIRPYPQGGGERQTVPLDQLPAGVYDCLLTLESGGTPVLSRSLRFGKFATTENDSPSWARSFGIVLDPQQRASPEIERRLLWEQLTRSVKVPIWPSQEEQRSDTQASDSKTSLLQMLAGEGFSVTGVLAGLPEPIAEAYGAYTRSVVNLLADNPAAWRGYLAALASPYAHSVRWWQFTRDDQPDAHSPDELRKAAEQVVEALRPFILVPRLGVTLPVDSEFRAKDVPADQITLPLAANLPEKVFAETISGFRAEGFEQVAVYLEPPSTGLFARMPKLASWAIRVLESRHAGASTVFVPQTWEIRRTESGESAEPTEFYILLRTLAGVIGDGQPGPVVPLPGEVRCLSFLDGNTAVLALWDPTAPPEGRTVPVYLGRPPRQIDLWGNVKSLALDEKGQALVSVSSMPILIDGVEDWLIDLWASLSISPERVESGQELVNHTIRFHHRSPKSLVGQMELFGPPSWQITPRQFSFSLRPGHEEEVGCSIRYSHREPAGRNTLWAKLTLDPEGSTILVPLSVDIAMAGFEVRGLAWLEGEELILRHIVVNHTEQAVHFRSSAAVPGRERKYRPLSGLGPRETQSVDYRFPRAAELAGRRLQLGLSELGDRKRSHVLELAAP